MSSCYNSTYIATNSNKIVSLITAVRVISRVAPCHSFLSIFPLHASDSPSPQGAGQSVLYVLLRVQPDHEAGDVNDLLPDSDVSLSYEDTGVVD